MWEGEKGAFCPNVTDTQRHLELMILTFNIFDPKLVSEESKEGS